MGRFVMAIALCMCGVTKPLALDAKEVLGEYWKDPIFGQAAASFEVRLEALSDRTWPPEVTVPLGQTTRFIVSNRSDETHAFVFTADLDILLSDKEFKAEVQDMLSHLTLKPSAEHHHHHSTSVDDAQDIVKTIDQNPILLVAPGSEKEMLIRFKHLDMAGFYCVIDGHHETGYASLIDVMRPEESGR